MGSFNKIGMISSLPIEANDDTVLIFMSSNSSSLKEMSGVVESSDYFKPTFLPIFGRYDDYGRIDNVDRVSVVKFIEEFFGDDIDSIIEKIDDNAVGRGGKITSTKNNDTFQKMTFGLEHKSVYDKLANECKYENKDLKTNLSRYGRELKLDGIGFSDFGFARAMANTSGVPYVDPIDAFIEKVGERSIIEFLSFNYGVSALNAKYFPSNYGSQWQDHALHYKMLSHYRNLIVNKISEYDEPEEILNSLQSEVRDEKLSDILKRVSDAN